MKSKIIKTIKKLFTRVCMAINNGRQWLTNTIGSPMLRLPACLNIWLSVTEWMLSGLCNN